MAILGKIRSYSGLLIVIVGVALAAFILGDLSGLAPANDQPEVGKIGKNKVMYLDFEKRVNEQVEFRKAQAGNQNVTLQELAQIRQGTWETIVRETLMEDVLKRNGIAISTEELQHLIHGPEPHREIVRNFSNPQTGEYDPASVINFLQGFDMVEPTTQNQWQRLMDFIEADRSQTKYFNMLGKGYYLPTKLALADFAERNEVATIRFVAKNISEIPDQEVQVSEQEIEKAYQKHKTSFERPASRSLQYVLFNVLPSQQDKEAILKGLLELKDEFDQAQNIESYINANSDIRFNPTLLSRDQLSPELEAELFNAQIGTMYGPYEEDQSWVLAKLVDSRMHPDSLKATHLLVAYAGSAASNPNVTRTINQARQLADSLLTVVRRNPAQFESLINQFSDDQSAKFNKGDLGWFKETAMVPGFSKAVVEAGVNTFTFAETEFGFHVIKVTGKGGSSKKVQVAKLARNITHTNQTFQEVFGQASEFVNNLKEAAGFEDLANEKGLAVREYDVQENTFTFPGIENPREIVRWAFDPKTNVGTNSQLFDLDNRFVVATVIKKTEKGIPPLDQILQEITNLAIKDKKLDVWESKFKTALAAGSLDAIADKLQLEVSDTLQTRFNAQQIPGIGSEPKVVGVVFGIKPGTISAPIKGNNVVAVVEKISVEKVETPQEIEAIKKQARTFFAPMAQTGAFNAIRKGTKIIDNTNQYF